MVFSARTKSHRGQQEDFFGLFDHVCVCPSTIVIDVIRIIERKRHPDSILLVNGTTFFVQTKTNLGDIGEKKRTEMREFPAPSLVMIWEDGADEPLIIKP